MDREMQTIKKPEILEQKNSLGEVEIYWKFLKAE